ncbi:MAG: Maf family protein [Geminicoccaceae bacterium]|nr:Maf family protein [Geminicoccaceae bacterium]
MALPPPRLVLASGSAARLRLLRAAGLDVTTVSPLVDEAAARDALFAEGVAAADAAAALAELKAASVARRAGDAFVLGADQLLVAADGLWLEKPIDRAAAAAQLRRLGGTTHRLVTAAVLFRGAARVWGHVESPAVTLRPLDDALIGAYLDRAGPGVLASVGAYEIEGLGAQLVTALKGDPFAVQGLPLLQLLAYLRNHGIGLA